MINAKELRIGNLVEYRITDKLDERKEWWEVSEIDADDIHWLSKVDTKDEDFRAIPITEELLLKIGAVKLDFKEFPSFNLKGLQINFVNGFWIEYVSRVEIKGLHFLQNIFYFRNSEELEVSVLTDR